MPKKRRKNYNHKKRDKKEDIMSRHHTYTKKVRKYETNIKFREIKVIGQKEHFLFHHLFADMSPNEVIKYLAITFLPTEYEILLLNAIQEVE